MIATTAQTTIAEHRHDAAQRLRRAGIEDACIEAEVLLRHALRVSREQLFARLREEMDAAAAERVGTLLARRLAHEPLAYLVGQREFFGLELACTPDALVPRPESELLVERVLAWVEHQPSRVEPLRVVDVGTGNGAIAIAIASHAPAASVVAIDTSRAALRLARANARRHGMAGRMDFVQGSLLTPLRATVDVIAANLPYIPTRLYARLAPEVRDHEPEGALRAGPAGTEWIDALLAQAPALLRPGGMLVAEHAWDQGHDLRNAAKRRVPAARIETARDLAGLERALVVGVDD